MERIISILGNKELLEATDDHELGALLLGAFIAAQAEALGIPIDAIPEEFVEYVRLHALSQETNNVDLMAFEKALHKAASGDFVKAGSIIRGAVIGGAAKQAIAKKVIDLSNKYSSWASSGGKKTAEINQPKHDARNAEIKKLKESLIKSGTSKRDVASKIANRYGLTASTVRRIFKEKN